MAKPVASSPATKAARQDFLAKSQANIVSLKKEAQRLSDAAAKIARDATGPLTDAQNDQIDAFNAAEDKVREKIAEYSAIENMDLNSPAVAKGLKDQIAAINKDLTGELKKLDKVVRTIKSFNTVVDGLTALLKAATAVSKLFV